MERWGILIGIAVLCGLGAVAGGLGFLVLYNAIEPVSETPQAEDWRPPVHVEEIVAEPAPAPVVPANAIEFTSDGTHPEVDIGLLESADWTLCQQYPGAVTVFAMRVEDELVSPVVLSKDLIEPVPELEQCVRDVVGGISASGAPQDYFMLSAIVRVVQH